MSVTWQDLGFMSMSTFDEQRRFFRIDREPSVSLSPRFTLCWIHQPSKSMHSKQHHLRQQRGIRSIAEAKKIAEEWAS